MARGVPVAARAAILQGKIDHRPQYVPRAVRVLSPALGQASLDHLKQRMVDLSNGQRREPLASVSSGRSISPATSGPGLRLQPPRLGEHNADVLSEAGFSGAEIARVADTGVTVASA
jgi:crotonobetainyl-CoA:carnitine CoA-transferase CaiB-like acyl-CoA transferase